jgi:hypothetical protein
MLDAARLIGTHDLLFVTLDTLRYDVAAEALESGRTPHFARLLPGGAWEQRHSPGNFTYAAHHAFFAGFFPTPPTPGPHPRLFAAQFPGSETTTHQTCVFNASDIVAGLAQRGYHTACIGGVGFFNKLSPLGRVLPGLFAESHWQPSFGVTDCNSTKHQVEQALEIIGRLPRRQRLFLFLNVSALHQPNCIFTPGAEHDTRATQLAALAYVDGQLVRLFDALAHRGPTMCIVTSDHGTAYGEDGYEGHRLSHPVIWNVPYAEFILPCDEEAT